MNNQNERIALAVMDTDDAFDDETIVLNVFKDNPDKHYNRELIRRITGLSKNKASHRVKSLYDKGLIKFIGKEALPGSCGILTSQYQFIKKKSFKVGLIINASWV